MSVHMEVPLLICSGASSPSEPHPLRLLDRELLSGMSLLMVDSESSQYPYLSKELRTEYSTIPSEIIKIDAGSSFCSKETNSAVRQKLCERKDDFNKYKLYHKVSPRMKK